jgi:hypothetical protein
MNPHYHAAIGALRETEGWSSGTVATAMAVMQTQSTLAVAAEQAKTNRHLELANAIAYAQLCKVNGDGEAFLDAMEDVRRARETVGITPEDDDH